METLRTARQRYFEENGFGADGGYGAAWVDFKLGPLPMPFPNTASRVRAVGFHDLHHVLTGYRTDTLGELEISAWELGAGCRGYGAAWVLNLGGMLTGAVVIPSRVFRAFVRGRHADSLYQFESDAQVLDEAVPTMRTRLGLDTAGDAKARVADVGWFALALAAGVSLAAVALPLMPVLLALGLSGAVVRKAQG